MTTTGKRRGQYPAGLFWNTARGDTEAEVRDNPRSRPCPWPPCKALPNQPCTVTTGRGRRKPLASYHDARTRPETGADQ